MDVPPNMSTGMPSSSSAINTPTCANPPRAAARQHQTHRAPPQRARRARARAPSRAPARAPGGGACARRTPPATRACPWARAPRWRAAAPARAAPGLCRERPSGADAPAARAACLVGGAACDDATSRMARRAARTARTSCDGNGSALRSTTRAPPRAARASARWPRWPARRRPPGQPPPARRETRRAPACGVARRRQRRRAKLVQRQRGAFRDGHHRHRARGACGEKASLN